ncbi:hypothetical protein [Pseudonocardia sp.]|uniref:hypothetical protein n=1 Tax=Pseudonocardia sp. TaxID=60912 RepID=UPI0026081098|nr:hypothetical protein [Pseudonocardia sp.]
MRPARSASTGAVLRPEGGSTVSSTPTVPLDGHLDGHRQLDGQLDGHLDGQLGGQLDDFLSWDNALFVHSWT